MQNRQQERGRLAAAGHRAGEQIPPLERRGNRFGLDGCRAGEAEVFEPSEEFGMELEVAKRQTDPSSKATIMAYLMLQPVAEAVVH